MDRKGPSILNIEPCENNISSIGWVLDCCEGGRGIGPWPNQHSGS